MKFGSTNDKLDGLALTIVSCATIECRQRKKEKKRDKFRVAIVCFVVEFMLTLR